MKTHRLFILVLLAASSVLLTGFKPSSQQKLPVTMAKTEADVGDNNKMAGTQTAAPPLDLSIPFKNPDFGKPALVGTKHSPQDEFDGLFTAKPQKTAPPFQLKGGWIISPEPEIEKQKSVDGAGIVINIKD
ncbi:MAG: hypothetical protein PHH59_06635 [Methylovulum sp.]|uniref:hypothetical protein n=1 Tax=Methylovulum sp. TaxID=1916980 RepID=UPI00261E443B|nr:hypothetical protein [Methylovulum sp.]MDD2723682.1 hypothetical protein [Methylovulum sp.]MDD5123344.1 hypothetical protein [Methylovulum sp.]